MTGLSTDSKRVLSAYSLSRDLWLYYRERRLFTGPSSQLSPSKPALDSQPTSQERLSWARLLQATLFAMGFLYGLSSLYGEYLYASGFSNRYVVSAVSDLRDAAEIFPLNYLFRKGSAQYLTAVAVDQKNPEWTKAALAEIYAAVDSDPTSADLLNSMRVFETELGKQPTHTAMYDLLAQKSGKRVK